jgi:signal transduction histidine kinase
MGEALRFLELKHNCATTFNYDLSMGEGAIIKNGARKRDGSDHVTRDVAAMQRAHEMGATLMEEHLGSKIDLNPAEFAILFEAREDKLHDASRAPVLGGIIFRMTSESVTEKARHDLAVDARLFIENWCIAFSTLRLRERLAQEQELRNQMYHDRLESIATMVTGVAHELNTPLGVARTAGSTISEIAEGIMRSAHDSGETDLDEAIRLMNKNLDRANRMIHSFRKLSTSQLSDEQLVVDIKDTIEDCMETMKPDLRKADITAEVYAADRMDRLWNGYPGHLSQVIINLTQNAIRYAYPPGEAGRIDVFIEEEDRDDSFRIRFVDYGQGVNDSIKPRMFDAFVTSGRGVGGTGLGLAIVQNIVSNLLHGRINCESEIGKGTCFTIELPKACATGRNSVEHEQAS